MFRSHSLGVGLAGRRHGVVGQDERVNRQSLVELLNAERVRPDVYSVDSPPPLRVDERLVMEIVEGGWAVYYAERGGRTGERRFDTEDEACRFMLDRLLADSGNRQRPA
jgi:hypothetical protein